MLKTVQFLLNPSVQTGRRPNDKYTRLSNSSLITVCYFKPRTIQDIDCIVPLHAAAVQSRLIQKELFYLTCSIPVH